MFLALILDVAYSVSQRCLDKGQDNGSGARRRSRKGRGIPLDMSLQRIRTADEKGIPRA